MSHGSVAPGMHSKIRGTATNQEIWSSEFTATDAMVVGAFFAGITLLADR